MWLLTAGWVASALVFSTFFMKTMLRLRMTAIASNLAFMCYGLLGLAYGDFGRLYPIFVLHATLLPLNVSRLHQIRKAVAAVTDSTGEHALRALTPYLTLETHDSAIHPGTSPCRVPAPACSQTSAPWQGGSANRGRGRAEPDGGQIGNSRSWP